MSRGIVTTSRRAQTTGGRLSPPVGIALRAAAVVTYLILTSAVLTQLLAARSAIFQLSAQVPPGSGMLPSAQAVAVEAPSDTLVPDVDMPSGALKVVTITVDGPAASVDVYCDTTTERAPFDHVYVSPEGIMDAYRRWCSPVWSE